MIEFFTGCVGLFTSTFNAANSQEFFRFLSAFIMFLLCVAIFQYLSKGTRRL